MKPETPPITIRRATLADAAAFVRINGDAGVLPNLLQVPYPSEESWRHRLGDILAPGKHDVLLVAERPGADGQALVVGNAGLMACGLALRRRHVMNLGIAIASEAQGQGVGHGLMKALCDWADDWGQVLRIELTVFTDNLRAIALYQRFGFVQEGLHRGYALRGGAYADTYTMARLHPAPPRIGAAA